jgi:hypothetical protein
VEASVEVPSEPRLHGGGGCGVGNVPCTCPHEQRVRLHARRRRGHRTCRNLRARARRSQCAGSRPRTTASSSSSAAVAPGRVEAAPAHRAHSSTGRRGGAPPPPAAPPPAPTRAPRRPVSALRAPPAPRSAARPPARALCPAPRGRRRPRGGRAGGRANLWALTGTAAVDRLAERRLRDGLCARGAEHGGELAEERRPALQLQRPEPARGASTPPANGFRAHSAWGCAARGRRGGREARGAGAHRSTSPPGADADSSAFISS